MTLTPKEKAKELYNKMLFYQFESHIYIERKIINWSAKKSALVAVDEIVECTKNGLGLTKFSKEYWQEVKQEIEKL